MNKIGQITYKHLENKVFIKDGLITTKFAAKECANIAEEMCIKFAEFSCKYYDEDLMPNQWWDCNLNSKNTILSTKELFQEFLKTL